MLFLHLSRQKQTIMEKKLVVRRARDIIAEQKQHPDDAARHESSQQSRQEIADGQEGQNEEQSYEYVHFLRVSDAYEPRPKRIWVMA